MAFGRITGYCDRPNAAPGETVSVHVSLQEQGEYDTELVRLINGDAHPEGPGPSYRAVEGDVSQRREAGPQRTQSGSFVTVADPGGELGRGPLTVHLFLMATTPDKGRQGVIARWDESQHEGWAVILNGGVLEFWIGTEAGGVAHVRMPKGVLGHTWYSVAAVYDPEAATMSLHQAPVVGPYNGRFGKVVPLDADATVRAEAPPEVSAPAVPLVIGGLPEHPGTDPWVVAPYNGKVDSPVFYAQALEPDALARLSAGERVGAPLARWDFAAGIGPSGLASADVHDENGRFPGVCVNQPARGMTGWNWSGREYNFVHAPKEYGALWFNEDALEDCRWDVAFEVKVPSDMPSGCYAVRLATADGEDEYYVPFFVRADPARQRAKILVLIPTYSYIAYANSQVYQNAPEGQLANGHITVLSEEDLELNRRVEDFGLSLYDLHSDGRGVAYSTWRRPIVNMQPGHQHEFGSVWQLPADLHLIDWLERLGLEHDVATDHDVETEGLDLFRRYNVVLTGTHPEYYSEALIDAWENYLATGGRGLYLGGNGMYWVTTPNPSRPWLIEVRRGEAGDAAWRGHPGEGHHSTTGEKGGLWRNRARGPQKIWGTGYASHTMAVSTYFEQMPAARDPRMEWMFEGIAADERIGDFGTVNGGAAGLEVDRYDLAQGTPPNTMLLASSIGHGPNAMLVPEELYFAHPAGNGDESPLVRGDITYFSTPQGGAMFSSSSMAWCASLSFNDYDNNVSKLTENVVRRFMADGPVPESI